MEITSYSKLLVPSFQYIGCSFTFLPIARQRQIDRHTEKFIRNLISTSQPALSIETNEILSTLKV